MRSPAIRVSGLAGCVLVLVGGAFAAAVADDWTISDPADNTEFSYDANIAGDGLTAGETEFSFVASITFAGSDTVIQSQSGTSSSTGTNWNVTIPVRTGGKWHAPAPQQGANNAQFNVTPAGGNQVYNLILIDQDP